MPVPTEPGRLLLLTLASVSPSVKWRGGAGRGLKTAAHRMNLAYRCVLIDATKSQKGRSQMTAGGRPMLSFVPHPPPNRISSSLPRAYTRLPLTSLSVPGAEHP